MENQCEALPGVAYPGVRDYRSTLNTKTGYDDKSWAVEQIYNVDEVTKVTLILHISLTAWRERNAMLHISLSAWWEKVFEVISSLPRCGQVAEAIQPVDAW